MYRVSVFVLACAASALAGEPVLDAADAALTAFRERSDALAALAAKDDPDPWLVADELCARGEFDAAEGFARAAPRLDVEKLPAYVVAQRAKPTDTRRRSALQAADAALASQERDRVLTLTKEAAPSADVTDVRLRHVRGLALQMGGRHAESSAVLLEAAEAAATIGWLGRQARALHEAGVSSLHGARYREALDAWERRLRLEEARSKPSGVANSLGNIGLVHQCLGDYLRAREYQERAVKLLEELGDRETVAATLGNLGNTYMFLGEYPRALECQERSLKLREEFGDRAGIAKALTSIGVIHESLGEYPLALEYQARSLKIKEELGDRAGMATALGNIGLIHEKLGAYSRALEYQERALHLLEALGDRARIAKVLGNIGIVLVGLGNYARALEYQERSLKIKEDIGDRAGIAASLGTIGVIHEKLGNHPRALECQERSLKLREEIGDRPGIAMALGNLGNIHSFLGDYPRALEYQMRSLKMKEGLGERAGIAGTLVNIASIHRGLGEYLRALDHAERALKLMEEIGDRPGIAAALATIGSIHEHAADYPRAFEYQERALTLREQLGDRAGIAMALGTIGNIHERVGDHRRALEYQERSLKLSEEIGDRATMAATLGNMGAIHQGLGESSRALERHERSLKLKEELGDREGIATTLGNLGLLHTSLKDYPRALEYQERSLELKQALGDRAGMALTLGNLGFVHSNLGDYPRAASFFERALDLARETGDAGTETQSLLGLGAVHLGARRPAEAARLAREAVTTLPRLVGGLAEEQGAMAREQWTGLFDLGVDAATALGDPAEAAFFLESGRAGSLLESLGRCETLRSRAVPEALQALEREARARETAAHAALQRALKGGDRAEVQARRADLDKAQADLEEVIARIQREAKAAGGLLYGRVDSLDEMRGRVREGEALVLYGARMALVVTREKSRIVRLGNADAACSAEDWAKLKTLAVDPLGLDPGIVRLLVSPGGGLSQAPLCLLAPDKEIVYVPSGTTYGMLLDDAGNRGHGVLALGDPDYGTKIDAAMLTVMRGGAALEPLPATREEAKAVGDTVLLGGEATEAGLLAAIGKRPRWRAVHLACHGLVNHKRAQLSALALSGGDFFTVLEVFGTHVPADLVVLSACETAKGAIYRAEGVMGFVRAFMFAGAPRVIVSLWKVDDEATKALMIRFYELWKAGKPAATALKEAQRFVASHEKWKDPKYWAAWQLWGLAD